MKRISFIVFSIVFIAAEFQAFAQEKILSPIYLRNNVVDSVYIPDIIPDIEEDYTVDNINNTEMRYDKAQKMLYITPRFEEAGITSLTIRLANNTIHIPVIVKRTFRTTLSVLPTVENPKAFLTGSFNGWHPNNLPMLPDPTGIPRLTLFLEPGKYYFKFILDGTTATDANYQIITDAQGNEMNMIHIMPMNNSISVHPTGKKKNTDGSLTLYYAMEGGFNPEAKNIIGWWNNTLLSSDYIQIQKNTFSITLPAEKIKKTIGMIRFGLNIPGGYTPIVPVYIYNGDIDTTGNRSLNDMNVYSVLIDRFHDGNSANNAPLVSDSVIPYANYKGGDFVGITKKIKDGYFSGLHINTLLLSPFTDNPDNALISALTAPSKTSAYLGLWPRSSEKTESRFGTHDELKTLVKEAHQKNISVILDYIADQVHISHPYYKENPTWFLPILNRESYTGIFNFEKSHESIDAITDNIVWWLESTQADGIKIDNAGTINDEFRRTLAKKINALEKKYKKNFVIIGHIREIPYIPPTLQSKGQMSGFLNAILYEGLYSTVIAKENPIEELSYTLASDRLCSECFNYLDEPTGYAHPKIPAKRTLDFIPLPTATQVDSMTQLKRKFNSLSLYNILTHTLPGIPILHTGEEIGFSATVSTTNPNVMYFGDSLFYEEKAVLAQTRKITALRAKHKALRTGIFHLAFAQRNWLTFIRSDNNEKILIAVNFSEYESSISCALPEVYGAKELVDIYNSDSPEKINVNNSTAQITIPAWGFRVFKIQ